jgi:hypothetical protein
VTLFELAYACYLYSNSPEYRRYNESYAEFTRVTEGCPNLDNPQHRSALLTWLRKWGCRQFARAYERLASDEVFDWWNRGKKILFADDRYLWELGGQELDSAGDAYRALLIRTASYRKKDEETSRVSIGPTGASKIMFAIRPNALAPWDEKIREGLGYSELGYLDYMRHLKEQIAAIAPSCEKCGVQLADLAKQLGRDHLSVPKLIDDFYWITITKREYLPDRETLARWVKQSFPHWACV